MKKGISVFIFPEGTFNETGQPLKEFHDGAFKLALDTGKPIMPAILFNTKKVLPPDKSFFFWPSKMEMHFLPPVTISREDDYAAVKQGIFETMSKYYAENKDKI